MLLNFKALFTGLFICFCLISGCTSNSEVSWNEEEGYRWTELDIGYFGSTGFSKLDKTGIQFDNSVREELVEENRHFLNGSGVAVGDVTGDGLVDIYFASLDGTNKLYENRGGFKFTDITEEAGLAHEGYSSTGVVFADVNANGHLDLLITSLTETNSLYINDGDGHFELKENSGLGDSKGAKTMALADITGNGHLDLYIANYKYETVKDLYTSQELSLDNTLEYLDGELHVKSPFDQYYNIINTANGPYRNEVGEADELYLNKGNGVFEKADDAVHFFDEDGNERGLSKDWGLTANFQDVTGDMLPDLYVANDFWTSDRLWINQGDGTFRLIETDAIQNMSFSAMGIDFSDVNRNGSMDFVVTEMLGMEHKNRIRQFSDYLEQNDGRTLNNRNSLFINRGDNTFSETAYYSGLQASEWSWATSFMDIDLDGYEDLIIATGFANDYTDMDTQIALVEQDNDPSNSNIISYPPLKRTNKIFRNNRDLTFTDKSNDWGFDVEDVSLGMALADLNNDGTLDVILNRYNEEAAVYENRTNAPRIAVHLNGNAPNTHGIGAKVKLEGGPVEQSKEMVSGGNYLSGSQAQVTFAADIENTDHEITVLWPSGRQSRISGLKANRMYIIDESASTEEVKPSLASDITPLFEDVSERINHRHYENDYDDFKYFPLLPKKLSQQGPGVAWIDYNQNGLDDLFIGSGKGGNLTIYENSGNGMFTPKSMNPATEQAPGDQTSIIGWGEGNYTKVIVGSANYEQGDPATASAYQYSIDKNGNVETDSLPGVLSTTGPMAATDYNGDGYVDLFIGGNFKPGQYPGNADSRLFRYADGKLVLDEANSRTLSEIGLVSGAVFTDYNQNGSQDLLISTEWGSLKLFENRNGRFHEITEEVGLDAYTGWWNGIATGDFTNNGFPDIIATNIGLNSSYQIDSEHPLKMFYGDFNWDGRLNILESYYDESSGAYVPRRKLHDYESLQEVISPVNSHREFSEITVQDFFTPGFDISSKEINTLDHMLFINNGDSFTAHPLPVEAQLSAAMYAGVADFDNDGNEDLFLSQNFYALPKHTPRFDGGRGLLLKGDGKGNLTSFSGTESGIKVYGEQRGASLSDFNKNGKTDIAISQNNGATKLYMNKGDKAGLRVQLNGPESNRDAIGSSFRIVYESGKKGPRREIQAGSGYLSQNSSIPVMGFSESPDKIEITWYNGRKSSIEVLNNKWEYSIDYE